MKNNNGYSPVLGIEIVENGIIFKVTDWIGGGNCEKPPINLYISETGYTNDKNKAQVILVEDFKGKDGVSIVSVENNPQDESIAIITFSDDSTEEISLPSGTNGLDGKDGKDGKDGTDGSPGSAGIDGKDGAVPEYRYQQNGSFTVPPSIQKSQRIPTGWNMGVPEEGPGKYTWEIVTLIKADNTLYQNWSDARRVTGTPGKDGTNGIDGYTPYILDLSNENSSVAATYEGELVSEIPTSKATVYYGESEDSGWIFGGNFVGCTGTVNSLTGDIVVNTLTDDTGMVNVSAQKGNMTLLATYTISKVKAGTPGGDAVIYYLLPSANVVKISKDGNINPTTLSCTKMKKVGNHEAEITTELILKYKIDNGLDQDYVGPITILGNYSKITFKLIDSNNITIDLETIPVIQDGKDGQDATFLDLSNENASVPASFTGEVQGSIPPTKATVYLGAQEATGWTFTAQFIDCTGTINSSTGDVTVSFMTADSARVIITASKQGFSSLVATYTLSKVRAGSQGGEGIVYFISVSENAVKVFNNGNIVPSTLSCIKYKRVGANNAVQTTDFKLTYEIDNQGEQDYTGAISILASYTKVTFRLKDDTKVLDIETVPVLKDGTNGVDGKDAYLLDLSNQSTSVPATSEGVVQGSIPSSVALVYKGNTLDNGWNFTAQFVGCTGNIHAVSGVITVLTLTADNAEVRVTATKSGISNLTTTYSITKVKAGSPGADAVVYDLEPSVTVVTINKNGTINPTSITCKQIKRVGSSAPVESNDKTIKYSINNEADQNYTGAITILATYSKITFKLFDGNNLIDIETVPVIKDGTDGTNGYGMESQYYITNKGEPEPNINSSTGWFSPPIPALTNTQTLWEKIRIVNPDGTAGPWNGPYKKTGEDGTAIQGPAMAYRGDWSNLKSYSGTSFVVDVVKYTLTGKGYIARTDAGAIPAGTLPTNTQYWNEFTVDIDALFADFIFAWSGYIQNLTVGSLKTATSGTRMEITPESNSLKFFKESQAFPSLEVGLVEVPQIGIPSSTPTTLGGIKFGDSNNVSVTLRGMYCYSNTSNRFDRTSIPSEGGYNDHTATGVFIHTNAIIYANDTVSISNYGAVTNSLRIFKMGATDEGIFVGYNSSTKKPYKGQTADVGGMKFIDGIYVGTA